MATITKKVVIALAAVAMLSVSLFAAPAMAYDNYKYEENGYYDENGIFRPYDYYYYHKDGYRYDSFYGDIKNYDNAYATYRYLRDRKDYDRDYSDYFTDYSDYSRAVGYYYNSYGNAYANTYRNDYQYNRYSYDYANAEYDYDYTRPEYDYDYAVRNPYVGSYLDPFFGYSLGGCSPFDYECQFHKARDIDEDYEYVQVSPNRYVRSDYFNDYYAGLREDFMNRRYNPYSARGYNYYY